MRNVILLCILIFAVTCQRLQSQTGLVAYWSFDEMENDTLFDRSVHKNHATNYGGKLIKGVKGKAIEFDGQSDYIRIPGKGKSPPEVFRDLGKGTISFWFRADHIPKQYGIAPLLYYGAEEICDFFDAANKGFIIELGHSPIHFGSEYLYFTAWKNGCTYPSFCYDSNEAISTGVWHHIVVIVGDDYNTGYLNGREMTNRYYNFGDSGDSQFFEDALEHEKMWLGKGHWDRTTQFFDGAMDELRIYNRALDSTEVRTLYQLEQTTASVPLRVREEQIEIFPNPASELLTYRLPDHAGKPETVSIFDVSGKTIIEVDDPAAEGIIPIGHLTPGIYQAGFLIRGHRLIKKIIIR